MAPGDVPDVSQSGGLCVSPAAGMDEAGSIIVPMARDRLLEIFDRVQRPAEVASTLEGALTGQLWQQQLLFQAMIDTWPRLQKALREVKLAARKAPWRVEPHARRGEKPGARAEKLAKEVEGIVWGMKPDPVRGLKGFEGTVEELAMGYFLGHHVLEPHWRRQGDGWVVPVSTLPVPPRYYGYPSLEEGPDRLMLDRNGAMLGVGSAALEDFPPHRFLVAVNGGHSGHPAQAAPLRVLTGYWLAAVYGLKWFMQFAQLFGIPFRWATYPEGDAKAKAELAAMMGNLGSQGWAAFKQGVEMNFLESGKSGGSLAQADLLKLADEQCDVFILGQTLTSSQGDRGSQALGNVHMQVRREVVEGVCDFVGEILTHQFIPAIVAANYGESRTDLPQMWAKWPEPRDEQAMASRDKALGLLDGTMPVDRAWLYERHAVPMPEEGAVLFKEEEKKAAEGDRKAESGGMGAEPGDEPPGPGEAVDEAGEVQAAEDAEVQAAEGQRLETERLKKKEVVVGAGYNENQPRHPKGSSGGKGGEWSPQGGGGKSPGGAGAGRGDADGPASPNSKPRSKDLIPEDSEVRKGLEKTVADLEGLESEHGGDPAKAKDRYDRYEKERDVVRRSAAANPAASFPAGKAFAHGGESWVEPWKDGKVLKRSKNSGLVVGFYPADGKRLELIDSLPSEQLTRHLINRKIFGDSVRLEGFALGEDGHETFVFSQKYIPGRKATPREIKGFMRNANFEKVTAKNLIGDSRLQGRIWISRAERLLVSDTKPDNFRIDDDGRVVPIDVISQQVTDDRMWSALSGE